MNEGTEQGGAGFSPLPLIVKKYGANDLASLSHCLHTHTHTYTYEGVRFDNNKRSLPALKFYDLMVMVID